MKLIVTAFFLFILNVVNATTYYVDFTGGNNGNTGLSGAQAWKTISKVNGFAFLAGDIVLFKSGETWLGETLIPPRSGTAATPMIFGRYGTGAKPLISGFITISAWTNLGSNIYEATVTGSPATVNMVTILDTIVPMGRYPNANATNDGYKTYTSNVYNVSITDPTLAALPNWTGATLIARKQNYATVRTPITSHVGTTLSFSVSGGVAWKNNQGYFIENSLSTLDQNGEWFYDAAAGKIKMYYTSTPPTIKVATTASLLTSVNSAGAQKSYVTIRGLAFKGSEGNLSSLMYCNYFNIDSCDFMFGGLDGIDYRYCPYLTITNSNFRQINSIGIREYSSTLNHHITISNDSMRRVSWFPGMIAVYGTYNETEPSSGIDIGSANMYIGYNVVDSIGYSAIRMTEVWDNMLVEKNVVSYFCKVKNDGGGIYYPAINIALPPRANVVCQYNIVHHSLNSSAGTDLPNDEHVRGLYADAKSWWITFYKNTVFSCWGGIYISQAQHINIWQNIFFDCGIYNTSPNQFEGAISLQDVYGPPSFRHTTYNSITNNIVFAKVTNQLLWYMYDTNYGADSVGVNDSNYYVNTALQTRLFTYNPTFPNTYYTLPQWQIVHAPENYDVHSSSTPMTTPTLTSANWYNYLKFEFNASDTVRQVQFIDTIYMEANGTRDTNAVNIQPWSSVPLIFVKANVRPTVSAGGPYTTTLPLTSVPITGTASDPDGIASTLWSFQSGPTTPTFTNAANLSTVVNGLTVAGVYTIKLKATGNGGAYDTASATTTITVNPAIPPVNLPPVISPAPIPTQNLVLPTNSGTATILATDADGTIVSYRWNFISGPVGVIISGANTATISFSSLSLGTYNWTATVIDNNGDSAVTTFQVNVSAAPTTPPIPQAGIDQTFYLPQTATTLAGSGTNGTGCPILTNTWTLISSPGGSSPVITTPSSYTSTFTNLLVAGTYVLRLTLTSGCTSPVYDDVSIIVLPVYVPPSGCNCFNTYTHFEN